jgi:hypothetical protein
MTLRGPAPRGGIAVLVMFFGTVIVAFLWGGLVGATWGALVAGVLASLDA